LRSNRLEGRWCDVRLHHLEITAFGPFAETAVVDFDALSDAGLFLLCGPTGAGKTSVLDAVCFAVYADVPGDRASAKRLRCDVAPEGRAPRVRLEMTLSGRRFRITRSPQWSRPKKRGSGTTTEQASVVVEERRDGDWQVLTTRMDEAGHLLNGLIGMTMPQFCQVVLLPQGRFQAFLRARSDERHKLLQQLFSTQRFEDVERWLRERSRVLHRDSQAHLRVVSDVTSRVLEASGVPLPEQLDDLTARAEDGALAGWARDLADSAALGASNAAEAERCAEAEETTRRGALDEARRVSGLLDRLAAARAEAARLEADAPAQATRRTHLERARRAAPVPHLHRLATSASRRDETAAREAVAALAAADMTAADPAALADAIERARTLLGRSEELVARERERRRLAERITETGLTVDRLTTEGERLGALAAGLPARIRVLRDEVEAAREATRELEAQASRQDELRARLAAHDRLESLRVEHESATAVLAESVAECLVLKETWLDLREARLTGMAAEIAADLAVGASCPVCGSADHPHKAAPRPGAPDGAAEKAARSRLDDAEVTRTALDAKVHELATQQGLTAATAGPGTREDAARDLRALRELLARLREAAAALPSAERTLTEAEAAATRCAEDRLGVEAALATARARRADDLATFDELAAELAAALSGVESATQLVADARHRLEVLTRSSRAVQAHAAATEEAARAVAALEECLRDCGFDTADQALAAVLTTADADRLEAERAAHDDALAGARAVLAEPEVLAVAELARPDLQALGEAQHAAAEHLRHTQHAARATDLRAARLTELVTELTTALDAWSPVRAAHAVASELAAFVEGKSVDNRLRMRLSAYVLAWRLTQVVAAANERLVRMTDQRYTLEHSGQRGAGETRGGLSLQVRDEWSGESRDPATLSGGETFVVSLALALGLADVVSKEAGGAELDTLVVDEGFGALDPDTLDDVMDTLDTLRDGGRVVGVVSHVGELRSRIPTRLAVGKGRAGSTLRLEHSVG